ncbi:retrovirus-related pol polyprotein from transposon, partial [Lasius niger]
MAVDPDRVQAILAIESLTNWLPVHENCLNEIKQEIVNAPILANFNSNKEVTIQADASQHGLGCCLLQNGKPVSYASRNLTNSEQNMAQIEKELLTYIPGKEMHIADLLSRSCMSEADTDDTWLKEVVHSIDTGLSITDTKKQELQKATITDS